MTLFGLPMWLMLVWLFVLGTVAGSFLNVCIHRIPRQERFWRSLASLFYPPSRCPYCKTAIRAYDNVPILGWLNLRGRCRACRHWISPRYPLIELFNGLLWAGVYWFEVPADWTLSVEGSALYTPLGPEGIWSSTWLSPVAILHWRYLYHIVLLEALVAATFIDFDLRIIPDGVTLPAMAVGLLGAVAVGRLWLVPVWYQDPSLVQTVADLLPEWLAAGRDAPAVPAWTAQYPHWHGLAVSVAGLIVGGGVVWVVRLLGEWVLRQEAMGFGDVILMAMIGSFIGWQPVVVVFFLAPLCALVVVALSWVFLPQREIPYGPYLSLATLLLLLGWQQIWPVAERVFALGPLLPPIALLMAGLLVVCLQLVQLLKRLLGIPLYEEQWVEQWTSADQLAHQAGENADGVQGRWPTTRWQGEASGRGALHHDAWRCGGRSSWQQQWQRRQR